VAAAKLPFQIAKPIVMSDVMTPAREAANSAVGVVVDASVSIVSEHLLDNPEVTQLIEDVTALLLKRLSTSALVAELIRLQAGAYLEYLTANPEILGPLVQEVAGEYLKYLTDNPEPLAPLVQEVAGDYIKYLELHPAQLDDLVRNVGDRYLEYLNEEPEQVQQLLAGQTMSISTEIIEEVRERSATADNVVENAVRKLFRMKPRENTSPKGGQAEAQES
jgi:hypothetical protein